MNDTRDPFTIDVVSDVVCPWCYLGKKRLEAAVAEIDDIDFVVRWRPYQLDASIPAEGLDRKAYMVKKFGDTGRLQEVHDRLVNLGKDVGIAFQFGAIERSPNTLNAHRLIRWAAILGAQDAVVDGLFAAYFEQGRDLGDIETLIAIGEQAGLDSAELTSLFASEADIESVQEEINQAGRIGVQGVPFFIMDGKLGVSGAQESATLIDAIRQAMGTA